MQSLQLYIDGTLVEFDVQPDVNYNYKMTDFEAPLDIKNGYSKTVVVPGTKNNHILFDNIWRVDRVQSFGESFNPSKRVPFQLFVDSTLYESGYVKLDTITKNEDGFYGYNITLYSGIGEFLYNLTYGMDGKKLKLSDLWYGAGPVGSKDTELDFVIDKDEVVGSWIDLGRDNDQTWTEQRHQVINFAPCYNGKPKNFSTNKVVLNMNTTRFQPRKQEDGQTYSTIGGYALGELVDDIDEWGMRDLRSWCQRPVIRMKKIIEACCAPINNSGLPGNTEGGYRVNLDEEWFNKSNDYYENTWLTLPTLDSIAYEASSGISGTLTIGQGSTGGTIGQESQPLVNTWDTILLDIDEAEINSAEISFKLQLALDPTTGTVLTMGVDYIKPTLYMNYMNGYTPISKYGGAFFVQLVGYNNYGRAVAGSDVLYITSLIGVKRGGIEGRETIPIYPKYSQFTMYNPEYKSNEIGYKEYHTAFVKASGNNYVSEDNFILKIKPTDSKFNSVKLVITKATYYMDCYSNGTAYAYSNRNRFMFWEDNRERPMAAWGVIDSMSPILTNMLYDADGNAVSSKFTAGKFSSMGSYASITKSALLDTKYTPADYLLSYCKMFGLYLIKHPESNTIDILTRKNFYKRHSVTNIEDIIDYKREWEITPITFNSKYYDFTPSVVEGEFAKDYSATTNVTFGMQRVDTGYDFNSDANVVTDKLAFKSCVEGIEKSPYYSVTDNGSVVMSEQLWMCNGFKYTLYGTGETTTTVSATTKELKLRSINGNGNRLFYDFTPKAQFRNGDSGVNGENVLLMYNGKKNTQEQNPKFSYYVTDDLIFMNNYNGGNACWLYTASELDEGGERIAYEVNELPVFERYKTANASSDIVMSLDFGTPRQLYVPDYNETGDDTVYARCWKSYFEDMYDIDNKILKCYIRIKEVPNPEMFRKFYWFQNTIWRLNSITNWVPGRLEPTQVEFLKVKDLNNYTTNKLADENLVTLTLSKYAIGSTGATFNAYITCPQGTSWTLGCELDSYVENFTPSISIATSSGTGPGYTTITIGENYTEYDLRYVVRAYGPYNTAYKYVTQVSEYGSYFSPSMDAYLCSYSEEMVTVYFELANCSIKSATASTAEYIETGPSYVRIGIPENTGSDFFDHEVKVEIENINGGSDIFTMWVAQAPEFIEFDATGGTFTTTSHVPFHSTGPWWIDVSETTTTHMYKAQQNSTTSARQDTMSVTYGGETARFDVYQVAGTGRYFNYNPTSFSFPHEGNTQYLNVSSNTTWSLTGPDWITLSQSAGNGDALISVTAASRGTVSDDRTGTLVFTTIDGTYSINVTQYGNKGRNLSVTASTTTIPSSGATVTYNLLYESKGDDTVTITTSDAGATIGTINWVGENGTVTIVYSQSSAARTITTTFSPSLAPAVTTSLTQTAGQYLTVSTGELTFDVNGGSQTFVINSSNDWEIVLIDY